MGTINNNYMMINNNCILHEDLKNINNYGDKKILNLSACVCGNRIITNSRLHRMDVYLRISLLTPVMSFR